MHFTRSLGAIGIAALLGCDISSFSPITRGTSTTGGNTADVSIQDFSFSPETVTVQAGGSVRWTNHGPSTHTTTSDFGVWDSGPLNVDGTFTATFAQAGTFGYHCMIHPPSSFPGFVGVVIVTP